MRALLESRDGTNHASRAVHQIEMPGKHEIEAASAEVAAAVAPQRGRALLIITKPSGSETG